MVLPIIFPILSAFFVSKANIQTRKNREIIVTGIVLINTILAFYVMYTPSEAYHLLEISNKLSISIKIDNLSRIFGTMVSGLWLVTTFYAFEYMTHEGNENRFFSFYLGTYGVVLGIAFSGNFITMYLFYELLTLFTLPLVMHSMDNKAKYAGRVYVTYMTFGAALVLTGFVFLYNYGINLDFVYGGFLDFESITSNKDVVLIIFITTFFGFGVKASIFPFYRWLPKASIAPTPVTAILHAVAVVKSGVFAIIRTIYYSFGTDILIGTWAQDLILIMTSITILFGSVVALRTPHIKRRFAYSTISNLSYIVFAVALMTPQGLEAGLLHMVYHGIIKIGLFFATGAILYKTHKEYLYEIEGFGYKMPLVFIPFVIFGIGLVGIPPFAGFSSKWAITSSAVSVGSLCSYIGVVALIISSVLTALYIFYIIVRGFMPRNKNYSKDYYHNVKDPNYYMVIPMWILAFVSVILGVFSHLVTNWFSFVNF